MRAAAVVAATIFVLGTFLAIAAATALTASWIGVGMLVIAVSGAVAAMLASAPTGRDGVRAGA